MSATTAITTADQHEIVVPEPAYSPQVMTAEAIGDEAATMRSLELVTKAEQLL
jgi:hypothetical protein